MVRLRPGNILRDLVYSSSSYTTPIAPAAAVHDRRARAIVVHASTAETARERTVRLGPGNVLRKLERFSSSYTTPITPAAAVHDRRARAMAVHASTAEAVHDCRVRAIAVHASTAEAVRRERTVRLEPGHVVRDAVER